MMGEGAEGEGGRKGERAGDRERGRGRGRGFSARIIFFRPLFLQDIFCRCMTVLFSSLFFFFLPSSLHRFFSCPFTLRDFFGFSPTPPITFLMVLFHLKKKKYELCTHRTFFCGHCQVNIKV